MNNAYKNIVLTGIPRSGSSLICSLYNDYENSLALLEPINPFSLNTQDSMSAIEYISNFFFQMRKEVVLNNRYITHHKNNKIVSNTLEEKKIFSKNLREKIVEHGYVNTTKKLEKDFSLLIKQNAFFTALLPNLPNFFETYVVVRNPLAVLLSWNSVNLPVYNGHVPAGEKFDATLSKKLQETEDRLDRQIIILDWFFRQFFENIPKDHVIYYENIVSNRLEHLDALSYNSKLFTPHEILESKNNNSSYDRNFIKILYDKITKSMKYYQNYYSENEILELFKVLND